MATPGPSTTSPPPTTSPSTSTNTHKPIDILPSPLSQLYTNLHPILLLSLLLLSFRSVVQDPVNTLLGLAPTVAIIQIIYCIVCLPSSGQAPAPAVLKPGQKRRAGGKSGQDVWAKVVPAILSLILTLTLAFPLLYILIILFGAPLTSRQPQTLLFSLHTALLTTPPLFYVHGLDAPTWQALVSLQWPVDEISGSAMGALVGGWLGAIPIPLDWDREWQRWPVTVLCGVYLGAVVGKGLGAWGLRGVRVKLD